MNDYTRFTQVVLPVYSLALGLLLTLAMEAFVKRKKRAWGIPALAIYATTAMWYFVELIYTPENLTKFSSEVIENCYFQVILFLVSFRLFLPSLSRRCLKNSQLEWSGTAFDPKKILTWLAVIWFCLLLFGTIRMRGDILAALLPLAARTGSHMWARAAGAGAGSSGFIVSSASYTYLLICSFFGVLLPLQVKKSVQLLNLVLILISWPYFILMGARNLLLAVMLPTYFSYALFSRQNWWKKALITVISFILLNQILTIIIAYRNVGFIEIFDSTYNQSNINLSNQKHLGLNMLEELCYINRFYQEGSLRISYGGRYLAELANIIPRFVWPEKPLIGIDYAILRGFGSSSSDIGVFATISTGFIGQGITNFGPYLGPIAPGFLLALWTGFLSRLLVQSYSPLRLCLFLVCLGLTFNLGRDITLLVLWPALFGYLLVRVLERLAKRRTLFINSSYLYTNDP